MDNFSEVGIRFKKYLDHKGLGVNSAAKLLGFSGSQVSNINNGRVFGTDKLYKILNVFTELNPIWLLKDEGEMIIESIDSCKINDKDNYKDKYLNIMERNLELHEEVLRLMTLIGNKEEPIVNTPLLYSVAEDHNAGLDEPKKKLK